MQIIAWIKLSVDIASVGEVAPGNKIKIVGEDGKVVPAGTTGDLYISNAMVKYLEYYQDPEKTKGSFAELDGEKYKSAQAFQ